MKRFPECRPNRWDILVVLAVLAATAVLGLRLWFPGSGGALTAVIQVEGEPEERVVLSTLTAPQERTISAGGYTLHLLLDREGAEMTASDCPTQDCVHTGHISRSGQSIVCLPARVTIRLVGGSGDADVDAVIG